MVYLFFPQLEERWIGRSSRPRRINKRYRTTDDRGVRTITTRWQQTSYLSFNIFNWENVPLLATDPFKTTKFTQKKSIPVISFSSQSTLFENITFSN